MPKHFYKVLRITSKNLELNLKKNLFTKAFYHHK